MQSFNESSYGKEEVPGLKRLKFFFVAHWRGVLAIITPIIFIFVLAPFPPKLEATHGEVQWTPHQVRYKLDSKLDRVLIASIIRPYQYCAYCLCIMAVYWVSECIALPVTSFFPLVIFPLAGIMDTDAVAKCYINDTIFLFLGSLIIATAVEQSGLHKRLAFNAINLIGYSHYKLLFALSFVTMFISMWLTNTAATSMMVPIIFAILKVFEAQGLMKIFDTTNTGDEVSSDLTACYFCSATYAATIGGIGTLVGTGTNVAFKGLFESTFISAPELLTFIMFSAFTIFPMLIMQALVYLWMIIVYLGFLRPRSSTAKSAKVSDAGKAAAKAAVDRDYKALGRFTFWELMVVILFLFGISLFFSRSPQIFPGWGDKLTELYGQKPKDKWIADSATAMSVSFLMLLLPYSLEFFKNFTAKTKEQLPKRPVASVVRWRLLDSTLPYSFCFLLGGGFALSTAAGKKYTDLNAKIGDFLAGLDVLPAALVLLIVITFTVLITNFASNVAVASVIVPIGMTLAITIKQHPLYYVLGSGIGASFCFMLPVGTPGNLIVQGAAKIPTKKMVIAGFGPTLICIIVLWLALLVHAPLIWPELKAAKLPAWAVIVKDNATAATGPVTITTLASY